MENDNFWDWGNEEEHRVSAVYRDMDAEVEDAKVQSEISQNNVAQEEVQSSITQNNIEQSAELQNNSTQIDIEQNTEAHNNPMQNSVVSGGKAQNDAVQIDVGQNASTQDMEVQNTEIQNIQMHSVKSQSINIEQTNETPTETMPENNFILVDTPQTLTQNAVPQVDGSLAQTNDQQTQYQQTGYQQAVYQSEGGYQQTEYQQTNFRQIIPVQNTQQNQGANKQKESRSKNTDYSVNFDSKDISDNKVSAMAAYLLGPVGIIIALLIARDSVYTAFHVRQALKITICSVVLEIIAGILVLFAMIPLVGIIFKLVLILICAMWLGVLILRLVAITQVCDGEAREPAIIGKLNCFH